MPSDILNKKHRFYLQLNMSIICKLQLNYRSKVLVYCCYSSGKLAIVDCEIEEKGRPRHGKDPNRGRKTVSSS